MRPRSGGSAEALWISQLIIQLYKVEYEYPAIMHGYLDSWLFCTLIRFPPRSKDFFFASCGSLFPFIRANALWVIHGFK